MFETTHGFLHLDQPVADAVVPAGPLFINGWAAGPRGEPLVDLRLRLRGKNFPVAHGFPRVDLVAHYGLKQPFLPAGFEAAIHLPSGRHEIAIEALTLAGEWHQLATVSVTAKPDPTPRLRFWMDPWPFRRTPRPVMEPLPFAQALRLILRQTATRPLLQAVREVVAALPLPFVLRYPHLPFHGHIDQPALQQYVLFGQVCVAGWLFHESGPLRRVVATVDLQTWQDLTIAKPTPHVAAVNPGFPTAAHAGIHGWIDVPAQLTAPLRLRTYAQLPDGSWHLCHIQHSAPWNQEQEKAPFASFSRLRFVRAAFALWRAGRARGFTVPWRHLFCAEVRTVRQAYRLRALPASPAPAPEVSSPAPSSAPHLKHVTLVTHNLSREGAPLLLWEFGRHLIHQGVSVHVLSPESGPLAALYTAVGATVEIVDTAPLVTAPNVATLDRALTQLAARINLAATDLVVANTLPSYWGVHLAHRAQRPSLFCIHESTTPASFWLNSIRIAPATLPLIESTFRLATHISFPTDTTRAYYRPWLSRTNHSINPSWIDVGMIDRFHAAHPRAALRRQFGLADSDRLVVNLGILCDRKGQHIFARAVDLLWRRAPTLAATGQFLMVGGRNTTFDDQIAALLKELDRPNLRIIPATNEPLEYYGAADLAVCTSYEESFPRVIMEAMASHLPILSTGVHGIGDMLESGRSGLLVPPGDTHALCEGLQHMLSQPEQARAYAAAARARVVAAYDSAVLLPHQTTLAQNVAHCHS